MGATGTLLRDVAPVAAGFLLTSVWQGLLLVAAVALCFRVVRGVSPAARAGSWTAVLVLILLLPLLAWVVPHGMGTGRAEMHVGQDWSVAVAAIWATLSVARAVWLAGNGVRLWRLAGRAVPIAVEARVEALLNRGRRAVLCVSGEIDRPSVTGFLRPRVLLPPGLLETLSPAELEHVVLHEMEHLRRGDDWLNLVQQLSLVLLPLNPALVWLDRRLCRERELACDDGVLQATHARRAYAACLVKLAEDSLVRKGVALALSVLGAGFRAGTRESELVGRVRRILAGPEPGASSRYGRLALGTLAAGVMVFAGLMARSPQMVQFDTSPEVVAQDVSPALPSRMAGAGAGMVPLRAVQEIGPRPVLTTAIVRSGAVYGVAHRVAAVSNVRRRLPVRALPVKTEVSRVEPRTIWSTVPVLQLAAAASPTRVVVTEFEVSQPMYAAVPWRGGWLIVQL